MNFDKIPLELKRYAQWICWRYEDSGGAKPTKIPYDAKSGFMAAVDNPASWSTFEQVVATYEHTKAYSGIGFVLTPNDPFCFIDLDATKDDATLQRQVKIFEAFDTYAERSPSGTGAHLLCKGHVAQGRKRGDIELYSSLRYMTMTGDALNDKPIAERQSLVQILWAEMSRNGATVAPQLDEPQREDDNTIINRAMGAANGDKFTALLRGQWQQFYTSQSEADFAFIDMLAFYSQNREQIVRLFKASGLGQRPKANRIDYVNAMLARCFDRMLPPMDFDALRNRFAELFGKKVPPAEAETSQSGGGGSPVVETGAIKAVHDELPRVNPYTLPPGLVGLIADFIYKNAQRPVPEIALAGAIGFMAGICGRAFNTPTGAGLNLYTLLIAKSGRGKEAMQNGISKLTNRVAHITPNSGTAATPSIVEFIGPSELRSDAALLKALAQRPCMVSIIGEFGLKLQAMTAVHANSHLVGLRSVLLDLYGKSGKDSILGEMVYSDKEKNTRALASPAFSILAETTPGSFYEGISENLIQQGLLPRFLTLEYAGERPDLNHNAGNAEPAPQLITQLASLAATCHDFMRTGKTVNVEFDNDAKRAAHKYDTLCTNKINKTEREAIAELWNRAHLKALKLASLIAVGLNPYMPSVDILTWAWAEQIVTHDVENIIDKFERGEVGRMSDSTEQDRAIIDLVVDYLSRPYDELKSYLNIKQAEELHAAHVIPQLYLTNRSQSRAPFKLAQGGPRDALYKCLRSFCDNGVLTKLPANKVRNTKGENPFHGSGDVYVINDESVFVTAYNKGRIKR